MNSAIPGRHYYFTSTMEPDAGYDRAIELARMALAAWTRESGEAQVCAQKVEDDTCCVSDGFQSRRMFGETQRAIVTGHIGAVVNVMPVPAGRAKLTRRSAILSAQRLFISRTSRTWARRWFTYP
jgi:hypothetical protein